MTCPASCPLHLEILAKYYMLASAHTERCAEINSQWPADKQGYKKLDEGSSQAWRILLTRLSRNHNFNEFPRATRVF
jgi:hypothetical protein